MSTCSCSTQSIGSFVLVKRQLRIPERNACYSVNEANRLSFPDGYRRYLDWAHANGYSSRYIGSMVADLHRILLKGGVFLYPPTSRNPEGKLRLMYEAQPDGDDRRAGGGKGLLGALHAGDDGVKTQRLLDVQPTTIHQRTSVVIGSPVEVDRVMDHLRC